jgi:hypothetical protein
LQGCRYLAFGNKKIPVKGFEVACAAMSGKPVSIHPGSRVNWGLSLNDTPLTATPEKNSPDVEVTLVGTRRMAQGAGLGLTLNPGAQTAAELLIACMTGRKSAACAKIQAGGWPEQHENAAARALGLILVDVATGRIEAFAGGVSPCFEAEARNQALPPDCPRVTHLTQELARDGLEGFQFHSAPLGSENKWPLALALIRAGKPHFDITRDKEWLKNTLAHSNTRALMDRMLCAPGFKTPCAPLERIPQSARDTGLNEKTPKDLLQLAPNGNDEAQPLKIPAGRLYQYYDRNDLEYKTFSKVVLSEQGLRQCARNKARWSACDGEKIAAVTSELWGRGNTRASVTNVAEIVARMSRAANGAKSFVPLHLVREKTQAGKIVSVEPAPEALGIQRMEASLILNSLEATLLRGTAAGTCRALLGAARCQRLPVALKTGTPGFLHDRLTWEERETLCANAVSRGTQVDCRSVPYKWAAAAVKDAQGRYAKVVVILAERNWKRDGRIDDPADRNNVSVVALLHYLSLVNLAG